MNDGFLSSLGLCRRAGRLVFGFETVKNAMQKGEAHIVFSATDLSQKTLKELAFLCETYGIEHIMTRYDMHTLGASIGKVTGIIAIADEGFAKLLKQKLVTQEGI